jgi:hypothetical protein
MNDEGGGLKLSGKLIDANGRQGLIDLVLDKERRSATWKLRLFERDTELPEVQGSLDVAIEGERMKATSKVQKEAGKAAVEIQIEATATKAGDYADQAYVGEYQSRDTASSVPVTRGVIILWNFR